MRLVQALRAVWGVVLLAVPGRVTTAVCGLDTVASRRTLRVLGGRQVAQAVLSWRAGRTGLELGAGVDTAHGLSCVGMAVANERWRTMAAVDAAVALVFASASLVSSRRAPTS